ncbi:nuclease domain-containing protein [Paraburkholderia silviterrae]|uniref:DUF1364 family protein n=1 Tax=Paraburkholderia silviterrae TaxID=2528715 RepID=A0A4R5MDZ8_9BURK|nr:nuclease domain-containing protein [Paraburkholderia silviterrae]TDG25345.1 DUF1364 family protein [Paraburkholderia silviterrae]
MKRTGFKRKPDSPFSSFANRATAERRAKKRSRPRKPTVAEGSKYLAACRDEPCYLRVPGICRLNPNDDTVVPCHSNLLEHGKGKGIKADNRFTFPGCGACHFWLDQSREPTKEQRRDATLDALARWEPVRDRKMGITEGAECSQ